MNINIDLIKFYITKKLNLSGFNYCEDKIFLYINNIIS